MSDTFRSSAQTASISAFNLDLGLGEIVTNLAYDIESAGLEPIAAADKLDNLDVGQLQETFNRWLIGKTPEAVKPLWEFTAQHVAEVVPNWAGHVALRETSSDHGGPRRLMLWSRRTPQETVTAYADGLEREWGVKIPFRLGAELRLDKNGLYTGDVDWLHKLSALRTLTMLGHGSLALAAESFSSGVFILGRAQFPLMVNPERDLRWGPQTDSLDCLFANAEQPDKVKVQKSGEEDATVYHLDKPNQVERFLNHLYRDTAFA